MNMTAYTETCRFAGQRALIAVSGGRDRLEACQTIAARYGVEPHHVLDALEDAELEAYLADQDQAYEDQVSASYRARDRGNLY